MKNIWVLLMWALVASFAFGMATAAHAAGL